MAGPVRRSPNQGTYLPRYRWGKKRRAGVKTPPRKAQPGDDSFFAASKARSEMIAAFSDEYVPPVTQKQHIILHMYLPFSPRIVNL